jgi:hypothetical protein
MADWSKLQAPLSRERDRLHGEINAIAGLMPLLMKRRNGKPWTQQDLTELRGALRRLPAIAPYVVVLVLPGSYVLLPVLAWWLDRRREQRVACNGDNQTRG